MRNSLFVLELVLGSGALSGCLLLDAANYPPATPVISGPSQLVRNSGGVYIASVADPDHQELEVAWGQTPGGCSPQLLEPGALNQLKPQSQGSSYVLTSNLLGPVCIWVRVRDPQGASASATTSVQIINSPPVAALPVPTAGETKVALYSHMRISAEASMDPDMGDSVVDYAWFHTPPDGVATPAKPCADNPKGHTFCFHATTPGTHTLSVVVKDNMGDISLPASMQFLVQPDQPPCLRDTEQATSLRLRRFDEPVAFGVAVGDDGDPFPPRENEASFLRFVWYFRGASQPNSPWMPLVQFDQSAGFRLPPNAYSQGDEIQVRVEAFDRTHNSPLACPPDKDTCESSPGCTQRLTWTVRYWL